MKQCQSFDNYLDTLSREILSTVYYYHNKIGNIDLYTIGCELSEWDGERILEKIKSFSNSSAAIVLNTCAVTAQSQKASEILADILWHIFPEKKLYITGCGVNFNKDYYEKYGAVCLENEKKFNACEYTDIGEPSCSLEVFEHHVHNHQTGLVKIQDGCHNHCSYCIINKLKPVPYSLPYSDIKAQTKALLDSGKKNIRLLGTELCFYEKDGLKLSGVCKNLISDFPEISLLSLGALDPASKEVEAVIDLIRKNPEKFSNVVTLSVQSCSDKILYLMKRRHTVRRLFDLKTYAGSDVYFAYHIIPGFPGETEDLFEETVKNLELLKPVYIHSMGFSPRKGTPAWSMVQNNSKKEILRREDFLVSLMEKWRSSSDYPIYKAQLELGEIGKFRLRQEHFPNFIIKISEKSIQFLEDSQNEKQVIRCNLTDFHDIRIIFSKLDPEKKYENIVLVTAEKLDNPDFTEVCNKLLTYTFGVKIVSEINLDDNLINQILSGDFIISNFCVYKGCFLRFKIDQSVCLDNLAKLLIKLKTESLYDLSFLAYDNPTFKETILCFQNSK